jgi:uncharacterized protein YdhG (YjbR/CyaY superfamily)
MPDTKKTAETWTAEEKAAMREAAKERRKSASGKADPEADYRAKIAELTGSDREMADKLDAIVKKAAPELTPRTWYGLPSWAKDGKVVCFFTPAQKFKERYASFGVQTTANLDDGYMWPTSWALTKITKAEEERLAELIKRAVS